MKTLIFPFCLLIVLCACSKELPHPETIKGVRLGMETKRQKNIAESNGICQNSLDISICAYKLKTNLYAASTFMEAKYNGKNVIREVHLKLFNPQYYHEIEVQPWEDKETDRRYLVLRDYQVHEIIEMYEKKYGKGEKFSMPGNHIVNWHDNELCIRLQYEESIWKCGEGSKYEYYATVVYFYNDECQELLEKTYTNI